MQKFVRSLEKMYDRVITQDNDRVVIVLGDEGVGKSTFMLNAIYQFEGTVKDGSFEDVDELFEHVVWSDPDELRERMTALPNQSAIGVMDAARLLNRQEAMKEEQKELIKDLYDSRTFEHLLFLGFQNPRSVPDDIASRRAKNMIYIPSRGKIHGYSRRSMDEWNFEDTSNLPEPDMTDSFPALDGTELWDRYREIDRQKKKERIAPADEEDDEPPIAKQIVPEVKDNLSWYISQDGRSGSLYIDPQMIELEMDCSQKSAEQARKLLQRDDEIVVEDDRVTLDGEVVHEVDLSDDEPETDDDEMTLKDIAEEVYLNLEQFIGKDGRSGDFMLDPDLIAFEFELSDRKARQVRKKVESFEDVSVDDDVVSVAGDVVASKSREL